MTHESRPHADDLELLLRTSRRSLVLVLALVLICATTLIAHALRPGSLLSDWPSRVPGLIPLAIVFIVVVNFAIARRRPAAVPSAAMKTMLDDEFRQANLARAQRVALVVVLLAQIPLAGLALSGLTTAAAVTIMSTTTVTVGMATFIVSFLVFDRE